MTSRRELPYVQVPGNQGNSHLEVVHRMQRTRIGPQIFAALTAALTTFTVGFHVGWPSPSLPKLQAEDSDIPITSEQGSKLTSLLLIGAACGSILGTFIVDKWGRKMTLLFAYLPSLVGCVLIAVAQNDWWFYVARFVAGLGAGLIFGSLSMYLGEIADDKFRGALGAMFGSMLNAGILFVYCVGPWINRQTLAAVGAAVSIISGLLFCWVPETPYFFMMKQHPEKARKSLIWLRGRTDVDDELAMVARNVEIEQRNANTSYKELVATSGNRKALIVVIGLMVAQQFSGIVAVLSYSSLMFEASGAKLSTNLSVIIIGIIQVFSGVLTIFIVDRAGRRPLLLFSTIGAIIFLSSEALYFQLQVAGYNVEPIYWLPVTGIVGYISSYTVGLGCLPFAVLGEILPCNVKAKATMIGVVTASVGGAIVTLFYQMITDAAGVQTSFWTFTGISVVSAIFIYCMVPETKQKSLRDIQNEFQNGHKSKPVQRPVEA